MSEPRDKDVSSLEIADFYMQGCEAVQAIDAVTPCSEFGFHRTN